MITGTVQSIGQASSAGALLAPRSTAQRTELASLSVSQQSADGVEVLFSKDAQDTLRTGFGQGTVSMPTAAIRTIGKGIDGARQMLPTTEELREEMQARAADLRQAQVQNLEERRAQVAEKAAALPSGVQQATNYLRGIENTISTTQARLTGNETPEPTGTRATITVGGQSFGYVPRETTPVAQTLNLTV